MTRCVPVSRDLGVVLRELTSCLDEFQLSYVAGGDDQARWMAYAPNVGFWFGETPRDAAQLLLAASVKEGRYG